MGAGPHFVLCMGADPHFALCGNHTAHIYNGQNTKIAGMDTATTMISSGNPMRQ